LIHDFFQQGGTPIKGKVKGDVTAGPPGWLADLGDGTDLVRVPMANMFLRRASNDSIITVTDEDGDFSFPGGFTPIDIVLRFQGPYVDVCSLTGFSLSIPDCADPSARVDHEHAATVTINGANNQVVNPTYDELVVAQSNAFYRVNHMRDWIRTVNPFDDTFDSGAPYTVRPNRDAMRCGAAFNESLQIVWAHRMDPDPLLGCAINFSFATTLWHEMGHWMNVRYGHGNSRLGFGEGISDVWAIYQADFHRVGDPLVQSRSASNTRCFCGDCPPCGVDQSCSNGCQGCHGGAGGGAGHKDGTVLMGAMWKVRQNLKTTHGIDLGGAIADSLFLGWMNAFSIGEIKSVIMFQWLILDDDDGIIGNGTPNQADIEAGFVTHGFPGLTMPPIRLVCQ